MDESDAPRPLLEIPAVSGRTIRLLLSGRVHHPRQNVGRTIHFSDGSSARVYRETRVGDGLGEDPALLVVGFVLRGVRGPLHTAFRVESWFNIPLFVGCRGFASKLWLAHDGTGRYRGIYEWDGAARAESYVRYLGRILTAVSVPGSVDAHIVPGIRRDVALADPDALAAAASDGPDATRDWWRPTAPPTTPR